MKYNESNKTYTGGYYEEDNSSKLQSIFLNMEERRELVRYGIPEDNNGRLGDKAITWNNVGRQYGKHKCEKGME